MNSTEVELICSGCLSAVHITRFLGVAMATGIGLGLMMLCIVFLLLGAGVGGIGVCVGVGAPTELIATGSTKS